MEPLLAPLESAAAATPAAPCFTFVAADGQTSLFTYREVATRMQAFAADLDGPVILDGPNGPDFVLRLLAAARSGQPTIILNHRLTTAEKDARLRSIASVALKPDNVVLFTTGTTGTPKAVALTWEKLVGAAQAANAALAPAASMVWQAALPLYHVGGLAIVVRSLVAGRPFVLYEHFDPQRLLADAAAQGVTHLSVVDKMLQDLCAAEAARPTGALASYKCILLGGGPLNRQTLNKALTLGAHVYASYGMTETSSLIAAAPVTPDFAGALTLLPGYEAELVDTADDGTGLLAVRGPGVTDGYLNAETPRTPDGFLITGDRATLTATTITIQGRGDDIFISGGENVSPAEIAAALVTHPAVADAVAFAVPDPVWGARPVAWVESPDGVALYELRSHLQPRLSRVYQPKHLLITDRLPRQGIGKIDRSAVAALYERRLEVRTLRLHRLRMPLRAPLVTAKTTLTARDVIIVELIDHAGRRGLGECDAFPTNWYLPETLINDWAVLKDTIAPLMLSEAFAHPRDLAATLAANARLNATPLARSAVECAYWDLLGQVTGHSLEKLVQDEYARLTGTAPWANSVDIYRVPTGTAIGLSDESTMLAQASACVQAGYRRIKVKIAPGQGLTAIRKLRQAYPDLLITADANQSFTDADLDELKAYDALNLGWIEEPLAPLPGEDQFARLSQLQAQLTTPLSLDESWVNAANAERALSYPALRSYTIKPAKFGGLTATLAFVRKAQAKGRHLWIGGLFETGIGRRMNAALATIDAFDAPGDLGEPTRYLARDIAAPAYEVKDGFVQMPATPGLGCALDTAALDAVTMDKLEMR